jgi:superfamily II DNA or RNA helicase
VLDESHHLIEVWGRLLEELLAELPQATVLGLTATPPDALSADQSELVAGLFGDIAYQTSIPAVVREGDLAPFAEMVWLTTPTPPEREWLRSEAARFEELVSQLLDPQFGSTGFLTWLDLRFLQDDVAWAALQRRHPDLCDAALRMHHRGLLGLPPGVRPGEQHRHDPTPDDWVLLIEDWIERCLRENTDREVLDAVRRALPSVGFQLTRRGIRRGRTPVDRVLARSAAKMRAAVEITTHEHRALGERMRTLVLCDHERASATLPADLLGVIDQQSGSAHAVLMGLVADPGTAGLAPLMVTGRTVAGAPETLTRLRDHAAAPDLLIEDLGDGVACLSGAWTSRQWVAHVTSFFQAGHSQVLVGTRALLGEGWDAPRITGLIDLTAVTTTTAVVQTRGRALRVDAHWPD